VGRTVVEKMILEAKFETRPDRAVDQRVVSDVVSHNQTPYPDHMSTGYSAKDIRRPVAAHHQSAGV
jgi:hypothetical protein